MLLYLEEYSLFPVQFYRTYMVGCLERNCESIKSETKKDDFIERVQWGRLAQRKKKHGGTNPIQITNHHGVPSAKRRLEVRWRQANGIMAVLSVVSM